MGQITSGIGLISGINFADLIDQLLAIEARPKSIIENRNAQLVTTQVAYQQINATLLAHKLSVSTLLSSSTFSNTTVASSSDTVITASSTASATPGSYDFTVDRLVKTQQIITKGFTDQDTTPLGPGILTFEFGDARLDSKTDLDFLNGGSGVQRGQVRITDRSGISTVIDLSRVLTVDDVIEKINTASGINVTASINVDGLIIKDNTGSTAATLQVQEVGSTTTASDLGITAAAVGDTLTGNQVNLITANTSLANLNDGLGVRILSAQDDCQINTQDGNSYNVDLAGAATVDDVISTIRSATSNTVTVSVNTAGTGLLLVDTTVGASTFVIAALNGSNAATDLGIQQTDGDTDGQIDSSRLVGAINSKLVKNINGGAGATLGVIRINNRASVLTGVDLAGADSIIDVIDRINNASAGVTASLNRPGNGILLTDITGSTGSNLIVSDVTGYAAADLNIAADVAADTIDSGNLQFRYLSENTTLASMNGGKGVASGKFVITDSDGDSAIVDLTQGNETTIEDVLKEINSKGLDLNARINNHGDGILIEDLGSGVVALTVAESGSTTAQDLRLFGQATNPGDDLDGTFERTVAIADANTLNDIAVAVNNASLNVAAVIINDGAPTNPYRINFTATEEGRAGVFMFDDGGMGLGATTLVKAQNAVVFFGSSDPSQAIAITSSGNTLKDIIPGTTIDLISTSDHAVQVTITRNNATITSAVSNFVDNFNAVIDAIDEHDSYDAEVETRGLLLGDPTVGAIRNTLFRLVTVRNTDLTGQFTSLSQVGIRVGRGGKLTLDQSKLDNAIQIDREGVEQLFTHKVTTTDSVTGETILMSSGAMGKLEQAIVRYTDSTGGTIQLRVNAIDQQIQLGNSRIEAIDERIAAKRLLLKDKFTALERTLATLQSQSAALVNLKPILLQSQTNSRSLFG